MLINTKPPTASKEAVALLRAGDKLVSNLFADDEATHVTAKNNWCQLAARKAALMGLRA